MDVTTAPSDTITCAKPGCGATTTLAESTYIDGCGQVCPGCDGPLPAWWDASRTSSPRSDSPARCSPGTPAAR
jgi:hypothetical protein